MRRSWPIAIAACLALGCGDGPPFTGTVSRSQYFEYHDQVDEPLCPSLLSLLDQHAQQIGGKVGLDLRPGDPPFRYYKFRDVEAIQSSGRCPPGVDACATGNDVLSASYFHAHEQAHDYIYRAWGGWSVGLLDEGEAVALTCEPLQFATPTDVPATLVGNVDWRELIGLTASTPKVHVGYHAAGYFVTYLVDRFGWDSLKALHRSAPKGSSAATLERAFAAIYPLSMNEAWAAALGAAGAAPCLKDWLCAAAPLSAGETAPPTCDGAIHRSVTVDRQPGIGLRIQGGNGEITLVGGCEGPTPSWAELTGGFGAPGATHWVFLPPGTYTFAELLLAGDPPAVTFLGYMPDNLPAPDCEGAPALPFGPDGARLDLRQGVVNGWVGLAGGGRTYGVLTTGISLDPDSVLEVCDGCSAPSSCVPVPTDDSAATFTLSDRAVLRLVNVNAFQWTIGPAHPGPYIAFWSVSPP
jgi:hypothetical protein